MFAQPRERAQVAEPASPTVQRRQLAAALRKLRDRADVTGEWVAERMGWSASKVSRIENAHSAPQATEIPKLAGLYGAQNSDVEKLLQLAQQARYKGWWEAFSDAIPASHVYYISLEAQASTSIVWAPEVITGMLQTKDYTREIIRGHTRSTSVVPPGEVEKRVEVRSIRQQKLLDREPPFKLNVILDQSALLRRIGSDQVMRAQLDRLLEISELEHVTLRIFPLDTQRPINTGNFIVLSFGEQSDITYHDVAYVEHLTDAVYFEAERETYQHQLAFDDLASFAAEPARSRDLINGAKDAWK